jgi:hypothetical protein
MANLKPPITGDNLFDSWAYNTTGRLEDIDAILSAFNLKGWTIEEDENGSLTLNKDGVTKFKLNSDGDIQIPTGKSLTSDL